MVCTIIALLIFLAYIIGALIVFKEIPKSISDTYYMYGEINKYLKYLFPAMIFTIVALMLPSWLEATKDSYLQFLTFLTCGSLLFVGAAPNFKSTSLENNVHTIGAIISAICAILWCILVVNTWGLVIFNLIYFLIFALTTKTIKKSYIFWLEMVAFITLFESLFIYNLIC